MGRHTATDGDAVHPVVAEALARRPAETAGAHRGSHDQPGAGPLGWPGERPAPGSGGLGWPGDLAPTMPVGPRIPPVKDDVAADDVPEEPAPPIDRGRRRGWRRLLGLERAA